MEQQSSLRVWVEAIGIVAVVASLIFVGLEVRQNAAATRGATQQDLTAGFQDAALLIADNQDLADLSARAGAIALGTSGEDLSDLTAGELARLRNYWVTVFRLYEQAFYQYAIGNLDFELWSGWQSSMSTMVPSTAAILFWPEISPRVSEGFRTFMDGLIEAS